MSSLRPVEFTTDVPVQFRRVTKGTWRPKSRFQKGRFGVFWGNIDYLVAILWGQSRFQKGGFSVVDFGGQGGRILGMGDFEG